MSASSLQIYSDQLKYNLSEYGNFTEPAVYDPDGSAQPLTGIYDSITFRNTGKDSGGNVNKGAQCIFMVFEILDFDIYLKKQITLTDRSKTYTINYIEKDETGAQVLWLS